MGAETVLPVGCLVRAGSRGTCARRHFLSHLLFIIFFFENTFFMERNSDKAIIHLSLTLKKKLAVFGTRNHQVPPGGLVCVFFKKNGRQYVV